VKLSSAWYIVSRPDDKWTLRGHVSVFRLSTIPSIGLSAREAMPVLKRSEGMSTMADPVVSEPVPAVVGIAISGRSVDLTGRPFPIGALM
jgi:hypothetical protein